MYTKCVCNVPMGQGQGRVMHMLVQWGLHKIANRGSGKGVTKHPISSLALFISTGGIFCNTSTEDGWLPSPKFSL